MKNMMRIIVPILLFGFLMTSCAANVRVRPAHGVVVNKVHHPKVVVHKNVHYYRSGGIWYVKKNRAYKRVVVPAGIRVTTLPRGYKIVKVRGVKYYTCKGVYYKRSGKRYVVVNV
ncbi:DUF6515 family protein [Aquimarina sediminis]|uniref:DUF6515 family protein n=1 Tax=Aquimarina sediminis TaxID=2070536 RepID=UPI000FFF54AC|nr:DUF6515 family protein [Aquimarina sediminis]